MGLDMYLSKKSYVKNWEHMTKESLHDITILKGGEKVEKIKVERIKYIVEEVAYWRKANQIHNWFVQNVQDGEDDCGDYDVNHKQLTELRDTCKSILEKMDFVTVKKEVEHMGENGFETREIDFRKILNIEEIVKLLPTASGFFFGGTEYDEYYIQDLEETVEVLTKILEEEGDDYSYHSSW